MEITNIYKEKNFIYFQTETEGKAYKYDINTGHFLGLRGNPIASIPRREIVIYLEFRTNRNYPPVIRTLREIVHSNMYPLANSDVSMRLLQLADKLEAIKWENLESITTNHLRYYEVYPSSFIEYFRKNPACNLHNFDEYIRKERWIQVLEPCNIDNIEMRDTIISILTEVFTDIDKTATKFIYFAIKHYLTKPMLDVYQERENNYEYYATPFHTLLRQIYTLSIKLNIPIKELPTYDIVTTHSILYRDYLIHKNKQINEKIKINQEKRKLSYENDDYIVIVPYTNKELITEGQKQHNCVGSYGDYIVDGIINVVFIRSKKDIEKSLITCEISQRGKIKQYLKSYNQTVTEENLNKFRTEYQTYLNSIW